MAIPLSLAANLQSTHDDSSNLHGPHTLYTMAGLNFVCVLDSEKVMGGHFLFALHKIDPTQRSYQKSKVASDNKNRLLAGLVFSLQLIAGTVSATAQVQPEVLISSTHKIEMKTIGARTCKQVYYNSDNRAWALCDIPALNSKNNFGLRLLQLDTSPSGSNKILFQAPNAGGDAYSGKLYRYQTDQWQVLLVDFAAEYYYGTSVYVTPKNRDEFKHVGDINWVMLDEDQQIISPTPFSSLVETVSGFELRFSKSLYPVRRDGSAGKPKLVKYLFDAKKSKLNLFK